MLKFDLESFLIGLLGGSAGMALAWWASMGFPTTL